MLDLLPLAYIIDFLPVLCIYASCILSLFPGHEVTFLRHVRLLGHVCSHPASILRQPQPSHGGATCRVLWFWADRRDDEVEKLELGWLRAWMSRHATVGMCLAMCALSLLHVSLVVVGHDFP